MILSNSSEKFKLKDSIGFPFWLHDVPGITFRSDNEPFKRHMQRFVAKIVTMMKHEGLYYPQGGPIIISQIENEYQMVEPAFGSSGRRYVRWAAATAVNAQHGSRTATIVQALDNTANWKAFIEPVPQDLSKSMYTRNQLLEQLATTKDETDYLWYIVSYENRESDGDPLARLYVESLAHILHAFVNNKYVDAKNFRPPVFLHTCRSMARTTGIVTSAKQAAERRWTRGVPCLAARKAGTEEPAATGTVTWDRIRRRAAKEESGSVHGSHDGPRNIVLNTRISLMEGDNMISLLSVMVGSPVGLFGEENKIYMQGAKNVEWIATNNLTDHPLIWYKGEVWVNGESIGRYWVSFRAPSGQPSQSLYNIPQSFLKPKDNLLVLVEEMGGNPLQITVNTMSITRVCGNANEFSVPSLQSSRKDPQVRLWCQGGKRISAIKFASYGNPVGDCRSFAIGSCHAGSSETVIKKSCLGRRGCSIPIMPAKFGGDPCPGIRKSLLVVANCM
ncbi:hypothetical protein GUJ93_ZPchr0010g7893 [Zizania palustris]|uniref:beta-galactosidase n=1 Tax=Zizania palustris TaxID=103762 RepID=A0A8J5W9T1_ZIZPA|nr:hypothetical protein GUJ93_ZPchr0010g7893 [Zizania palustris]